MSRNFTNQEQKILLERVSHGDVKSFRLIFDAYNKRLYAAALKITKSAYAAEEIVQEVFAGLWKGRSKLTDVRNPQAYILTIAYNRTFRYLKKTAANKSMLQSLRHRICEARNPTEEWMDLKETGELLDKAVEELPPRRQLIFKLSRENGLSHKEIAVQLKISPLTVKKQIVMALKSIRASL